MCCVYSCIVLEYMGCGDDLLDYLSYVCEIDGGSYDRTYSGRAKRKEKKKCTQVMLHENEPSSA